MKQQVIFGNSGNESLALLRWSYEIGLQQVIWVSVDTGWQASAWQQRLEQVNQLAQEYGITVVRLTAMADFAEMVEQRGSFPTRKLQWCAGMLKGSPLLTWLDAEDPLAEATVITGHWRGASRGLSDLPEIVTTSEYYGDRKLWHPLFDRTRSDLQRLVQATGLPWLAHRSLECQPCVNNSWADFRRMDKAEITKTAQLEQCMQRPMFAGVLADSRIENIVEYAQQQVDSQIDSEQFSYGCGSPYGCGF